MSNKMTAEQMEKVSELAKGLIDKLKGENTNDALLALCLASGSFIATAVKKDSRERVLDNYILKLRNAAEPIEEIKDYYENKPRLQ